MTNRPRLWIEEIPTLTPPGTRFVVREHEFPDSQCYVLQSAVEEDVKRIQNRADLLDDLVTKAAYVNDRYAQDREQLKGHIRILLLEKRNAEATIQNLMQEVEVLRTDLSHTDGAYGLTVANLENKIREQAEIIERLNKND